MYWYTALLWHQDITG